MCGFDVTRIMRHDQRRHLGTAWHVRCIVSVANRRRQSREFLGAAARMTTMAATSAQDRAAALFAAGEYADARDIYASLVARNQADDAAHTNLAQCHKRLGDWLLAGRHFRAGFESRRRAARLSPTPLSAFRIEHALEQLLWLRGAGQAAWCDDAAIAELARMARLLRDCYGPHRAGPLPIAFADDVMALVHGCPHWPDVPVPDVTFNTVPPVTTIPLGADDDAIHVIDDVLTEDALAALRRFLTEATIWYDARPERRYLGAHLHDGLASDLMLRLIADAQAYFARFVGRVRIVQAWAFKYAPTAAGIDLHADQASWNLNIWPTPTDANLDPASGGMTIAKFRAPPDWTFQHYNAAPERHRAMLASREIEQVTIPYRGNRAVLFPSKYLHKTDDVRFASAYDVRRINLTFMAEPA